LSKQISFVPKSRNTSSPICIFKLTLQPWLIGFFFLRINILACFKYAAVRHPFWPKCSEFETSELTSFPRQIEASKTYRLVQEYV
jgi:hypothetical protein